MPTSEVSHAAKESTSTSVALGMLFLYSVAMFSLPFAAYFGVYHILTDYYPVSAFTRTAWSVSAAVVVVNVIIFAYIYKAYHEKEYDEDGNEIDQYAYPAAPATVDKSRLNLKED